MDKVNCAACGHPQLPKNLKLEGGKRVCKKAVECWNRRFGKTPGNSGKSY